VPLAEVKQLAKSKRFRFSPGNGHSIHIVTHDGKLWQFTGVLHRDEALLTILKQVRRAARARARGRGWPRGSRAQADAHAERLAGTQGTHRAQRTQTASDPFSRRQCYAVGVQPEILDVGNNPITFESVSAGSRRASAAGSSRRSSAATRTASRNASQNASRTQSPPPGAKP
jgi:hypothetical protein